MARINPGVVQYLTTIGKISMSDYGKYLLSLDPDYLPPLIEDKMRRTGRTTKMVDAAIQHLFNKDEVNLGYTKQADFRDHAYEHGGQDELFKRVVSRLSNEHKLHYNKVFEVDHTKRIIKIRKSNNVNDIEVFYESVEAKQ